MCLEVTHTILPNQSFFFFFYSFHVLYLYDVELQVFSPEETRVSMHNY